MAGTLTKQGTVCSTSEGVQFTETDPATGAETTVQTLLMGVVLDAGTRSEQRVSFAILESDFVALGSPGYGAAISITLAT